MDFGRPLGAVTSGALPEEALVRIARQCEASDIADILAEMERLSDAKNALPAWDGDAQEGIAKAQETLSHLLAAVAEPLRLEVAKGLESPDVLTRVYVGIALVARQAKQAPGSLGFFRRVKP
ncbi:MAG: hypothetical protein RJB62_1257 [Pseudomonadota bacterium]|jgi:hypothetical protein